MKLDQIAAYCDKVEPCKYNCLLVLGCLTVALSVIFITHIFMFTALRVDGKNIRPFLNRMLEVTYDSPAGFMSTILIVLMGYYLMAATFKGNVKIGLRFFFVSFYPLAEKETFVNSFMANCLIMNIWMVALIQFLTQMFRGYLRGTEVAKIFLV